MRYLLLAFAFLAAIIAAATPAQAGRIFTFAEGSDVTTVASNSCVRTRNIGTTYAYTTVNCNDVDGGRFELPAAFPSDAGNTWTAKVHYQTPDTGADKICAYSVRVIALPHNSDAQGLGAASTSNTTGVATTHVAGKQYVTAVSSPISVWNGNTDAACANTDCVNSRVRVIVELLVDTVTASQCNLSMVELIY